MHHLDSAHDTPDLAYAAIVPTPAIVENITTNLFSLLPE